MKILIVLNPLASFEIQKCQHEPRFNCAYSRNRIPTIKDQAYLIYLDECDGIITHGVAFHLKNDF